MIEVIDVAPTWHWVEANQILMSVSAIPEAKKYTLFINFSLCLPANWFDAFLKLGPKMIREITFIIYMQVVKWDRRMDIHVSDIWK